MTQAKGTVGKRTALSEEGQALGRNNDQTKQHSVHSNVAAATSHSNPAGTRDVKLFGQTPRVTVEVQGMQVGAMADSGAEVSMITEAWYQEVLLPMQVALHGTDVQISDANGMEIPCVGYVRVDLRVEEQVIKDCGLFVKRTGGCEGVVQGMQLPVLLGMNVLAELVQGWQGIWGMPWQSEL